MVLENIKLVLESPWKVIDIYVKFPVRTMSHVLLCIMLSFIFFTFIPHLTTILPLHFLFFNTIRNSDYSMLQRIWYNYKELQRIKFEFMISKFGDCFRWEAGRGIFGHRWYGHPEAGSARGRGAASHALWPLQADRHRPAAWRAHVWAAGLRQNYAGQGCGPSHYRYRFWGEYCIPLPHIREPFSHWSVPNSSSLYCRYMYLSRSLTLFTASRWHRRAGWLMPARTRI